MAFYENQSDMFSKRAQSCKKHGDMLYAKAMESKERGDKEDYSRYMAQAQTQYRMQQENESSAKKHEGKTWK